MKSEIKYPKTLNKQFEMGFDAGWKEAKIQFLKILKNNIDTDYSNDYGPGMGGAEPNNPQSINVRVFEKIKNL